MATSPPAAVTKLDIDPLHANVVVFHTPEQSSNVNVGGFVISPLLFTEVNEIDPELKSIEPVLIRDISAYCLRVFAVQVIT